VSWPIPWRPKGPCGGRDRPCEGARGQFYRAPAARSRRGWTGPANSTRSRCGSTCRPILKPSGRVFRRSSAVKSPRPEGSHDGLHRLRDLLDDFYQLFARNMRDLGTPVYARRFFDAIVKTFPPRRESVCLPGHATPGRRILVWLSADVGDSVGLLGSRYDRLAPNMLLYGSVLEFACREGFQQFDFGRSSPASGTYRFKEQWGARPVPLYWHYWLRDGRSMPDLSPRNSKYSMAIKLWSKLPVALTRNHRPANRQKYSLRLLGLP